MMSGGAGRPRGKRSTTSRWDGEAVGALVVSVTAGVAWWLLVMTLADRW